MSMTMLRCCLHRFRASAMPSPRSAPQPGRAAHGCPSSPKDTDHHAQRGGEAARGLDFLIMPRSISSVALKSAITPSFGGRIVLMLIGLLVHLAGLLADGHEFACVHVQSRDRRFVDDNLAVVNYQRIGRSEVDGQLLCQRKIPILLHPTVLFCEMLYFQSNTYPQRFRVPADDISGQRY